MRVKWSLEMEEQFRDLSIISMITANKSTVKGNFEDGIYIKGRRTEFERVSVCGGRLEVWLPVDKEKKELFGKEFVCPGHMEIYEEYVCEEGSYGAAFEVCQMPEGKETEVSALELAEAFREETEEEYPCTCVSIANIFDDEHLLCLLVADGELNHQTVYAYIYFLRSNENIYRCYFFCSELKREEICYLAKMIIGNIEVTGESNRDGITLRKRDGKVK